MLDMDWSSNHMVSWPQELEWPCHLCQSQQSVKKQYEITTNAMAVKEVKHKHWVFQAANSFRKVSLKTQVLILWKRLDFASFWNGLILMIKRKRLTGCPSKNYYTVFHKLESCQSVIKWISVPSTCKDHNIVNVHFTHTRK